MKKWQRLDPAKKNGRGWILLYFCWHKRLFECQFGQFLPCLVQPPPISPLHLENLLLRVVGTSRGEM